MPSSLRLPTPTATGVPATRHGQGEMLACGPDEGRVLGIGLRRSLTKRLWLPTVGIAAQTVHARRGLAEGGGPGSACQPPSGG